MCNDLTKDEIIEIKDYFNKISEILTNHNIRTDDNEKIVKNLSESVLFYRENYLFRWKRQRDLKANLDKDNKSKYLNIDFSDKKDKIIEFLENSHFSNFLPTDKKQLSNIVDTLFYKDLSFNEEEINIFQKSVLENLNKGIEDIYQLAFPKEDFINNEDFNLKTMFLEILSKVKHKDRTKFIAGVSTFINESKDTYLGRLKIEIINNNFKESSSKSTKPEEKLNASNKWFEDFESILRKVSLSRLNFKFNKDKRSLQLTTASDDVFDVWLVINDTKKNELSKEEISIVENTNLIYEIEKIEEKHIKNLRSVQVNSSIDIGHENEKDSILRQGISNVLMSLLVADYYVRNKRPNIENAINKGVPSFLLIAISNSLKEDFELNNIKPNEKIVLEKLKNIKTRIDKEPLKYLREFLKTKVEFGSVEAYDDLRTKTRFVLTKPIINMIHNLINYYNYENCFIIKPRNIFSSFRSNATNSTFSKPLVLEGQELDNDDVLILLQYSTLLKSVRNSATFSDNYSCYFNDIVNHYFKNHSHVKNKKNRTLLDLDFKIAEVDRELLKLFFYSENSKNNLLELNEEESTLLTEYISCILAEKKKIFSVVGLRKIDIFEGLKNAILDEDTRMIFSTQNHILKLEIENEWLEIKNKWLKARNEEIKAQIEKKNAKNKKNTERLKNLSKEDKLIIDSIAHYSISTLKKDDSKNEYLLFLKTKDIHDDYDLLMNLYDIKDFFFEFLEEHKDFILEDEFKEKIENYKKEEKK